MATGRDIAEAARTCVGARFRHQGRDVTLGLDCVGVVAVALGAHLRGPVPMAYAQRGGSAEAIGIAIEQAGLSRIAPAEATEGDVVLLAVGPGQWHFAVLGADAFIHADARLRRVTETPGRPPWPTAGAWRLRRGED